MTTPLTETTLTILSKFELKDLFNADEFGLYSMPAGQTFNLENEKSLGGKKSKMRLTGMAVANALDEGTEILL